MSFNTFNHFKPNKQELNRWLFTVTLSNNADILVPVLIQAGADVNTSDTLGNTLLMSAVQRGKTDAVRTLLHTPGIRINQPNVFGDNPLQEAIRQNLVDIIAILQQHGAVLPPPAPVMVMPLRENRRRGVKRTCPDAGFGYESRVASRHRV